MICLTPESNQSFFVYRIQSKEKLLTEKELFKEKVDQEDKKRKEGFLIAVATAIKKDPTSTIRKHSNELKIYEKIKQNCSPDVKSLD